MWQHGIISDWLQFSVGFKHQMIFFIKSGLRVRSFENMESRNFTKPVMGGRFNIYVSLVHSALYCGRMELHCSVASVRCCALVYSSIL